MYFLYADFTRAFYSTRTFLSESWILFRSCLIFGILIFYYYLFRGVLDDIRPNHTALFSPRPQIPSGDLSNDDHHQMSSSYIGNLSPAGSSHPTGSRYGDLPRKCPYYRWITPVPICVCCGDLCPWWHILSAILTALLIWIVSVLYRICWPCECGDISSWFDFCLGFFVCY